MHENRLRVGGPTKSSNLIRNALFSLFYTSYCTSFFWKSDIFFSSRLAIVSSLGTFVWNTPERNSWIVIEPFFRFRPSKKSFPKLYLFFPLFLESTRRGYGSPPLIVFMMVFVFHLRCSLQMRFSSVWMIFD